MPVGKEGLLLTAMAKTNEYTFRGGPGSAGNEFLEAASLFAETSDRFDLGQDHADPDLARELENLLEQPPDTVDGIRVDDDDAFGAPSK